jgi:UDP-2,4-diacetamido-2,4,6-trideoxy-beta-L-altropyranose hydrolase
MQNLVILTEAGKDIGYGHYMRCNALKDHLIINGINALVFVNYFGGGYENESRSIKCVNWLDTVNEVEKIARRFEYVLVDSYIATAEYYEFLKKRFKKVIAIDDYNRIQYPVNLIINPNIYGDSIDYTNQSAISIGGTKYVILRKSIRDINIEVKIRDKIEKVLVIMGGSDYRGLMPKLIDVLNTKGCYDIVSIAGTEEYMNELKTQFSRLNRIYFYGFVDDQEIVKLFNLADVVVTAAGQTLNELAYMGQPTIAICVDDDQKLNIKSFYEKGFLVDKIFWDDEKLYMKIIDQLDKIKDASIRLQLSQNGRELIDGKGVANIYKFMKGIDSL